MERRKNVGWQNGRGPIHSYLSMCAYVFIIGVGALKKIGVLKFFLRNGYEFVVVWAKHFEINIVIPRDKTFLSDCSYGGPSTGDNWQIVFLTYGKDFFCKFELDTSDFFGGRGIAH